MNETNHRAGGPHVFALCALKCEAAPLIARFSLAAAGEANPFNLYESNRIAVLVTGIGKTAAAAGVGYLRGRYGSAPAGWLNFGLAGHAREEVGAGLLAHRVTDRATGRRWFPAVAFRPPCPTAEVVTVDSEERSFDGDALYEMEAAGFMAEASRSVSAELVHCLKVVSDNRENPVSSITPAKASKLIEANMDVIEAVFGELDSMARFARAAAADPGLYDSIIERWRFTATQRHRLRRALKRLEGSSENEAATIETIGRLRGAPEVIKCLERIELTASSEAR